MRQLVYAMFRSNNRTFFHLRWKENLVKHQKGSKYYEIDCLQNFLLFFLFSLRTKIFKKGHIYSTIYFIFLKNLLKQTWNSFNTKFQSRWKDRKSCYQVRWSSAPFYNLIALYSGLNGVKGLRVTKVVKEITFEGVWDEFKSKKSFQRQ